MQRTMLKSKLHRVHVPQSELPYEGSCAIDEVLLEVANFNESEQIHIYNEINGECFNTYAILGEGNSGIISVNGAAAHKVAPHDILITTSYAQYFEPELEQFNPQLGYVDENNRIQSQRNKIPALAA